MPAFWIYKCNGKDRDYQRAFGDWAEVFESTKAQWWGTTKIVPELARAAVGDTILAYQTDRNELVGIARVVAWKRQGQYNRLVLKPTRTIGVRVRALKEANARVARIPALQPGPIRTLYPISPRDARTLLKAAGVHLAHAGEEQPEAKAERAVQGAGFGTPEQNKLVERAAIRHVKNHYKYLGWSVRDVSPENRGYDLLCKRSGEETHVEVKGARGDGQQFIITAREVSTWSNDKRFVLAFVGAALTAKPSLSFFPRAASQKEFVLRPLSYIAKRQPNPRPHTDARKSGARR
jgi:hypothetical protein